MVSSVTINGLPCRLTRPITWSTYRGVAARVFSFPMMPKDADKLLNLGVGRGGGGGGSSSSAKYRTTERPRPTQEREEQGKSSEVTIKFKGDRGEWEFKRCLVIDEGKASTPFEKVVRISDRRWYWTFNEVDFLANERRISGDRRIVSPPGVPIALEQIADDVIYSPTSLNPDTNKPWKPLEVIEAIMTRVVGKKGPDWYFSKEAKSIGEALVQDFYLYDKGHIAVARALALIPGLTVWQHPDGRIVVDTYIPGTADKIIQGLGDPLANGQFIKRMNWANQRPAEYHNLYTPEYGYRFDFYEKTNRTVTNDEPWLKCVYQTVSPRTTLPNGKVVPMGTFVEEEVALQAFTNEILANGTAIAQRLLAKEPLNLTNVNKHFITNLEWVYLRLAEAVSFPDLTLQRQIREIKGNHRQQFQMNPKYVHSCFKIKLKNPGFIDTENSLEQDSPIYTDYAIMPSRKGLSSYRGNIQDMAFNLEGGALPYELGGRIAADLQAQARASWISEQLGIFRIDFRQDPTGIQDRIIPGQIESGDMPSREWFKLRAGFTRSPLKSEHKMNIIVGLIPKLPNDDRKRFRVSVSPKDVEAKFKIKIGSTRNKLIAEERVGEGFVVAQFPYVEDKHDEVKKALGIIPGDPNLGDPINLDALKDLTLANAFAYYLSRVDHYTGSMSIPMRNDIPPRGEIMMINHIYYPGNLAGALNSSVECGIVDATRFDPMALVSQSTRRLVQGAVNPKGA